MQEVFRTLTEMFTEGAKPMLVGGAIAVAILRLNSAVLRYRKRGDPS